MNGHKSIIRARQAGGIPSAIFIRFEDDFPEDKKRFPFERPENFLMTKQHAMVELKTAEPWRTYDFRFVVGCQVHLSGSQWNDEFLDLAERLVKDGAKTVVASSMPASDELLIYRDGEWHGL